jgi:hypothetical protein
MKTNLNIIKKDIKEIGFYKSAKYSTFLKVKLINDVSNISLPTLCHSPAAFGSGK